MTKQDPQQQSAPKRHLEAVGGGEEPGVDSASPELTEAVQAIADSPSAKPGAPEKTNSQIEAERNITRRIMEAALQEVRALPRVWHHLSEDAQDEVIHRIRLAANETTVEVIATVAAGASKARAIVEISSVTVKAKTTDVKLQIKSTDPQVHAIVGARGEKAVLVLGSDPMDYGINRDGITADAQQLGLPMA